MIDHKQRPLVSVDLTQAAKNELLDIVREARLNPKSEAAILDALEGSMRVLPEGKLNPTTALVSLSYEASSGRSASEIVQAIAAIEFLMAAGDVLDDVQDGESPLQADRCAVGQYMETLSYLLMLCHHALGRLEENNVPPHRIVRAFKLIDSLGINALRGQTNDIDVETRDYISLQESLDISRLKSSSLIRCAAELGATLGTDCLDDIDLFGTFGWHYGLALQLMNDVEAIWPGNSRSNKSDLRLKKKTLPVAYVLNLPHTNAHAKLVQDFYLSRSEPGSEIDLKQALWRSGAVHYAWVVAGQEKAKAQRITQLLAANLPEASRLEGLLT